MPRFISSHHKLREPLSVKEFYEMRKTVLVLRETGGLGDIFMHRMMFEDFKNLMPDGRIVFACPKKYHPALYDHPYIYELLDSKTVDYLDYVIHYNTTSACTRHEMQMAPFSDKNRADIWANHCGVELKNHNMHITIEDHYVRAAKNRLSQINKPIIALAPVSAMRVKDLLPFQLEGLVAHIRNRGCHVFAIHNETIPALTNIGVEVWTGLSIREWMGAIKAADGIVSVDTAAFHCAGGMGRPLTGIFTFADGKAYGKYYDFVLVQKHRDNGDWPCGPCYTWSVCPKCTSVPKPCLTEISVGMLTEAFDKMLERWPQILS